MATVKSSSNLKAVTVETKKAALTFRAINHPLRQQMMMLMEDAGKMNVTQIYKKLKLEQSVASQHLAILRGAGLVTTERDGKTIWYSVNPNRIALVYKCSQELNK